MKKILQTVLAATMLLGAWAVEAEIRIETRVPATVQLQPKSGVPESARRVRNTRRHRRRRGRRSHKGRRARRLSNLYEHTQRAWHNLWEVNHKVLDKRMYP